ncbi:MAG: orotidine 5'-phosphate decarboxylase [Phylliscum demangeonii]|nr:MAG: orotidine 5'-phosphate decarboxylase [Phylliscum demangeonii]
MSSPTHSHHPTQQLSFLTRAALPSTSSLASYLFRLMTAKQSNLCLSADVCSTAALLRLAETVGDSICLLKTHADIIDDFGPHTVQGLLEIGRRKKFLIFEDRKFGDIGSTVQKQYIAGPLRIAQWASLINAHIFPGPAIVRALKCAAADSILCLHQSIQTEISAASPGAEEAVAAMDEAPETDLVDGKARRVSARSIVATVTIDMRLESPARPPREEESARAPGREEDGGGGALDDLPGPPLGRGLLLLAEMSSEGSLMTSAYTEQCVALAREHRDFVLGFVAQRALNSEPDDNFVVLTPGVSLPPPSSSASSSSPQTEEGMARGDGLGQQYRTPREVVFERGCDVIIVGRGILKAEDPVQEAERYRKEGWSAYLDRLAGSRPRS